MSDLISREAALDMKFSNGISEDGVLYVPYRELKMNLEELPSAQPERKTGKWEVCDVLDHAQRPSGRKILRCPFCKYLTDEFRSRVDYYCKLTNFCPNCGAKMEGRRRWKVISL